MYVVNIPNRNSPPATLLRESYREDGKVKNRTLSNLSHWPKAKIEALQAVLKGATSVAALHECFDIDCGRPHGHVAAVLGTARKLGLETLLASRPSRERQVCLAMLVSRILAPGSKLATTRGLAAETRSSSLGEMLALNEVTSDELYEAMDWLLERQERIENTLAQRHLKEGTLVLYDVSSTYFEGRHCPLARLGYSRDGQPHKLQIVFGLLTNGDGCPVSVEVFEGNTADPSTVRSQVDKLRQRFGLERVILVGDRGMLTSARIQHDLKGTGIEWITALRGPAIKKLVHSGQVQMSLFDERDLAELISPDFPGERLIVCKNPLLADERARKRQDLLEATEKELNKIVAATRRANRPLRGKDQIGLRVGRVLGRFKMAKHFQLTIDEHAFRFARDEQSIQAEALLDGLYVIRTNVSSATLDSDDTVRSYKRLAQVERAFRSLKTVDLKVRPIFHRLAERVRAHVFLCMLAYYVEWHMRQALAPMLFDDDDKSAPERKRSSVVAPARRSDRALNKARTLKTDTGQPVHSFHTLLQDLAKLQRNTIRPRQQLGLDPFEKIASPSPVQQRALTLLGVRLSL